MASDAVKWAALVAFTAGSVIGYISSKYPIVARDPPAQLRETIVKKNDLGREFWHKSQERWT